MVVQPGKQRTAARLHDLVAATRADLVLHLDDRLLLAPNVATAASDHCMTDEQPAHVTPPTHVRTAACDARDRPLDTGTGTSEKVSP
jgi:hypothetical protein